MRPSWLWIQFVLFPILGKSENWKLLANKNNLWVKQAGAVVLILSYLEVKVVKFIHPYVKTNHSFNSDLVTHSPVPHVCTVYRYSLFLKELKHQNSIKIYPYLLYLLLLHQEEHHIYHLLQQDQSTRQFIMVKFTKWNTVHFKIHKQQFWVSVIRTTELPLINYMSINFNYTDVSWWCWLVRFLTNQNPFLAL